MINEVRSIFALVLLGGLLAACGAKSSAYAGESFHDEYTGAEGRQEMPAPSPPLRVLFVGNSLTYYNNVPAVFSALAEASGTSVVSDMIVAPGATLTQRGSDGSIARALEDKEYSALVLQERGGDFICAFGPDSCVQAREAIKALAALARERGVKTMLMGSYQRLPEVSRSLVEAEASAASEAAIPYIEVSEKLQRLTKKAPDLTWFADDGQHPGKHLALLNAILVHEAVLGSLPDPGPLVVKAPIYGGNTGLDATLRQAEAPPPRADTPLEVRYSSETVRELVEAISN